MSIEHGAAIVCVVSAVCAAAATRLRSRRLMWGVAIMTPLAVSLALYWSPVLLGAPVDEHSAWAVIFLVPWYLAGVVTSASVIFLPRRNRR